MLFFGFEVVLFVLAMIGVALAEFVGRGAAFTFWAALTGLSLAGKVVVLSAVATRAAADTLEEQWRGVLADNWRHANLVFLLGLLAFGGWWWLESVFQR